MVTAPQPDVSLVVVVNDLGITQKLKLPWTVSVKVYSRLGKSGKVKVRGQVKGWYILNTVVSAGI